MQQSNESTIFIFEAEEGMILSQDVICPSGRLVAPKGSTLDNDMITAISNNHILEIVVWDGVIASEAVEPSYFDKIQASPEFQKFSKEYGSTISNVKNNLNDIVFRSKDIDVESLAVDTNNLLAGSRSNLQIFDMLHSLRANDDLTFVHCVNVSLIACIIGRWLKLPEDDIKVLSYAGLLHDIGKLLIPEEILLKPGKLTKPEFDIVKTHVSLGFERLKNQDIDIRIKEACLLHHEKCDGSGYPFNLKADKIPLFTKIITIADVYDAMTAARIYRGSMCPFDVIRIMEQDGYTKYDPNILLPFLNNVVSSYLHNTVRLSNGQAGEVILINKSRLSRPCVLCENGEYIDLTKRSDLSIQAIL